MPTVKEEVKQLLDTLPDDCSLEDVQYHLYVIEKIQYGVQVAEAEGTFSQLEVEGRLKHFFEVGAPLVGARPFGEDQKSGTHKGRPYLDQQGGISPAFS